MTLKPKLEAIIYAAETPITVDQMVQLVKESADADLTQLRSEVLRALTDLKVEYSTDSHGIEVREIAGGYRMSTKP